MLSVIVAAVFGAVFGTLTKAGLKWGRDFWTSAVARIRRDHRTLHGGGMWSLPASVTAGSYCSVRVLISCAPSRSLHASTIDPDLAIPFIRESFPGLFPAEPSLSLPGEGVKFSTRNTGSISDHFAWAWATGRVDLAVDVQLDCNADQIFMVPLLEVLRPITLMAAAVSSPGYDRVYGRPRTRLCRRFDWFIAVSTVHTRPDAVTAQWDGVTFPGRVAPRAGAEQRTVCPAGGYAARDLRSWKAGSPAGELIATFLRDFLKQNGYHDVAAAVSDTVCAAGQREKILRREPGMLPASDGGADPVPQVE